MDFDISMKDCSRNLCLGHRSLYSIGRYSWLREARLRIWICLSRFFTTFFEGQCERWSHNDGACVGDTLLDVLVRQDHRLVYKHFVFEVNILCNNAYSFDTHPVPDHILPAYNRVPNEDMPLDFCLRQNCWVWYAWACTNYASLTDDDVRA